MSALLNTLPGDIPGLLQPCSPVVDEDGHPDLIARINGQGVPVAMHGGLEPQRRVYRLVLSGPCGRTGRANAAWWTSQHRDPIGGWTGFSQPISVEEGEARRLAIMGADMTPTQIDTLARLVLRLAGRTS